MSIENNIIRQISVQTDDLAHSSPGLLEMYPIENYVHEVKACKEWQRYYYLSSGLKKIFQEILSNQGLPIMAKYHKLAVTTLMHDSLSGLERENIPPNIRDLYLEWFKRVLKDVSTQPDEYYDTEKFPFLQDLAVCSLRAIPVGGAWFVEVSRAKERHEFSESLDGEQTHAITKKITMKRRIFSLLRSVTGRLKLRRTVHLALRRLGMIHSFYQLHTFNRYLLRFTPEEMDKAYLRIGELLRRNKRIKGLFRRSWFLDPQLENISPELAYLRKVPEENGAIVFRSVTFQSGIDNALAMSPKRRKLYRENRYSPQAYAYLWPRKELLKWAKSQKDSAII